MDTTWTSASHCRDTLKLMLDELTSTSGGLSSDIPQMPPRIPDDTISTENINSEASADIPDEAQHKRRKYNNHAATHPPLYPPADAALSSGPDSSYMWQPVLEYTGPDFGFDANQFCRQDAWQEFLAQGVNPALSGLLFDNVDWDSYVKTFGDRLS